MVEIPDSLRSLFTTTIEERDGTYLIEIPEREVDHGSVTPNGTYRVAVLPRREPSGGSEAGSTDAGSGLSQADREPGPPAPPVDESEVRTVTIESLGDQGDGIAKVERGYVVIVPDTEPGDEPTVEIEDVRENVAFATTLDEGERAADGSDPA